MSKKARTPIVEYDDVLGIELGGDGEPQERDHLTDQDMVIAYDRRTGKGSRWRLRAIYFDRGAWTRSAIRRWWAAHEIWFLAPSKMGIPVPEICRSYPSPDPSLPTILLCHRNTPQVPADKQLRKLDRKQRLNRNR